MHWSSSRHYEREGSCMKPPECFPSDNPQSETTATVNLAIGRTETLIAKQQYTKTGLMQHLLTRGIHARNN